MLLSAMPGLTTHFVKASVRNFASSEVNQAMQWAGQEEQVPGQFVILDGYSDDVVAISAKGHITRDDYEKTLIPLVEEKIKSHGSIKMLYWCGEEFKGFSAGAAWDDAHLGMTHIGDFSKLAFVSDIGWLRQSVKLFAPLMKAPVQVFNNADIEKAKDWINQ